ncbi:CHASE3 domain-containing protein [Chlorogloeopsis sp. ULAP02]|uniref:sensor histidine kinase n=1 Tax=Chlorogloeopsis sp. ULAP02 TaxID=3107926 RepID=UPI003136CDD5
MLLQITRNIFRRRLISAIALPTVLLLLLSGVSLWQINRLLSAMQWVEHTDWVITQTYRTQKLLLDLQSGSRGYLLTGEEEFLEPYQEARLVINAAFRELNHLVSDNPSQVERVNQLQLQYQEWQKLISQAIERKNRGEAEPLSAFKVRKQKMDAIRSQIAAFIATEEQLRNRRSQVVRRTTRQVSATSVILALGIGAILAYFIRRQLFKVSQSYENALKTSIKQTENAQRSAQRLADLHKIDRAILAAESNFTIVRDALGRLRQLVNCQRAFLVLFNFETGTTGLIADSSDPGLQPFENTTFPIEDLQQGTGKRERETKFPIEVTQQRQVRLIQDISKLEQRSPILEQLLAAGLHSCLTISMQVEETLIGELTLAGTQAEAFNLETQQIVSEVATQLAIAIQQSQLREQLQNYAEELEQRVQERTTQLQEANQELEAFSYSVSHDLRAPLRTIQGFAQALQEEYSDQLDAVGQEYISYITDDAVQMDTLVTDLLAYSHLSRTQIQIQPVDLNLVVNEALKQLSAQLQEQQAEVTVDACLGYVLAHRSTLVQVLTNLLSNAIKFVNPGTLPSVHIYTQEYIQEGQNWIRLWVVDNGIGIASEHQERIFRVFERLHGVETYPGTGIGLAIVRKGLERMGGSSGVESQLGTGTSFWIALPKAVLNHNATA